MMKAYNFILYFRNVSVWQGFLIQPKYCSFLFSITTHSHTKKNCTLKTRKIHNLLWWLFGDLSPPPLFFFLLQGKERHLSPPKQWMSQLPDLLANAYQKLSKLFIMDIAIVELLNLTWTKCYAGDVFMSILEKYFYLKEIHVYWHYK